MGVLDQFTVVCWPQGGHPFELTPRAKSLRWSTLAVGGFGSCSFQIEGDYRQIPFLARIQVRHGTVVVFEGRVEDRGITLTRDGLVGSFTAFGWKRLLDETTVRRIWSTRSLDWTEVTPAIWSGSNGDVTMTKDASKWAVSLGQFDPADLSRTGVEIRGIAGTWDPLGNGSGAYAFLPDGFEASYFKAEITEVGTTAFIGSHIRSSADGVSWTNEIVNPAESGQISEPITAGKRYIAIGLYSRSTTGSIATSDALQFEDIRLLATSLDEDDTGGFHGGSLLEDLLALIPGLHPGIVEDGSDFVVESLERAIRDTALSVVQEVAGYYDREWAVWEDGRFDWRSIQRDEPQWVVGLQDCDSLSVEGSLDTLAKRVYVLYTDAATGLDAEASADATRQSNPYVKAGGTKDELTRPGFPMTANTSAQLAARRADDLGRYPPVRGRVTLAANRMLPNMVGPAKPAFLIRAGENIAIPELPQDDPFIYGRDGQTLFHIVSTETDLERGTVDLELEGQSRATDVLLARLAAVTRTITG